MYHRFLIEIYTKECLISPLVAFGLSLLVFSLGKVLFRYGIVLADEPALQRERQIRFTTRSFFAFTFLAGLLMVTMKLSWQDFDHPYPYPYIDFYAVFMEHEVFLPACLTFVCLPIPYLLMNNRSFAATKTLLYAMFMVLVIFPFATEIYLEIIEGQVHGAPWYSYELSGWAMARNVAFSGGALLGVMVAGLSLMRSRGIRLIRQTQAQAPSASPQAS